jgi:hypothetical protein
VLEVQPSVIQVKEKFSVITTYCRSALPWALRLLRPALAQLTTSARRVGAGMLRIAPPQTAFRLSPGNSQGILTASASPTYCGAPVHCTLVVPPRVSGLSLNPASA